MIDKIFLDMDGVIVNFRGQCEKYECINGNKVNWEVVHQGGPEFWEEMEWLPEGKELYEWILKLCEQENIDLFILTSVNFTDGKIGKLNWLKNNTKIDKHHIIITNLTNLKQNYCGTFDILFYYKDPIDDENSGLCIFDFKTNKELRKDFSRENGKFLLPPFGDLYEEPLSYYTLQLSCYQLPLEDIGLKVIARRIVWLKDDGSYELIPLQSVTDRLRETL